MRIAFFNWRDIRNPLAGGAEVYVHEILRCLARKGHRVTLFSSTFKGASRREVIDGIEHIRYGGRFLMYPLALSCYDRHIKGRYDAIVESVNGVPFFTVLFAKEKVFPLVHQLTRENWYSGMAFPLSLIGYHAEDHLLRLYDGCEAIAVSESTKKDLEGLGFRNVTIIYGAAPQPEEAPKKVGQTILFLGRLTKSKRVDHVLRAFKAISEAVPASRLVIAGRGPEGQRLRRLASSLGISAKTDFLGWVSEKTKRELLSSSRVMMFPAVREGWGLVVLEANAYGIPVIGYDVHGLRDSIKEGVNGHIVKDGDFGAMARRAIALLRDEGSLERLSKSSAEHSRGFSWDRSCEELISLIGKP